MTLTRPVLAALVGAVLAVATAAVAWHTGALAAAATRDVTWTRVASQPFTSIEAAGIAVGGKLYSFGGYDTTKPGYTPTDRAYAYDPATNRWAPLRALPSFGTSAHGGVTHAGVATDGDSIFIAGGYPADAAGTGQTFGSRAVYRYDPTADTYTRLPDLPVERAAGGLAFSGGVLHFFGGTNLRRDREAPEHWALTLSDLAAGWVAQAPMPNPRNHLATTTTGGKIYVIGGQTGQDAGLTAQSTLSAYDPATDAWATLPSMPKALSHSVAATVDGQIVVLGGQTSYNVDDASTYAYDPATARWTALTALPARRFSGIVGAIDGLLYFSGGSYQATSYRGALMPLAVDPTRRFNFQPAASAVPVGYTAETGRPFTDARGYGWVGLRSLRSAPHLGLDLTGQTRERASDPDQRLDTFIRMQPQPVAGQPIPDGGAWELKVQKGRYEVTVGAGDPDAVDSNHSIRIEGQTVIDQFIPTPEAPSTSATATVRVTDGRLTVDPVGGTNTKLQYVTVRPVTG